MGLPASRRKNVAYRGGRRKRLPDVPGLSRERPHWEAGRIVAGVDEVGRGAWAGPVTYAAVILPSDRRMYKLRDSKMLDPVRRQQLSTRVREFAVSVSVGEATNAEIDRIGMSAAMRLAARRAVEGLEPRPDVLLLDGNWDFCADLWTANECIVHGDAYSASIAAASIVAKVARDTYMVEELGARHPEYDFASNKGYPSPAHQVALSRVGACPWHRRSWKPLRNLGTTPQMD